MSDRITALPPMHDGLSFPSFRLFWSLSFAYASFMAVLLQKAVLPLFPEMHAGHGLLLNDAIVFHNMASEIACRIHAIGWSEWRIYPQGASANVALLSALYALLGPDPAWFIPFNAAAHASGALLIYRIGTRLVDGGIGKLGGLLAAICFLVFPSALQWYGQNHKDAFAIIGLLLALDAWLVIHDDQFKIRFRNVLSVLFTATFGAVLLGLVRPYYVVIMALGFFTSFLISSIGRSKFSVIAVRLSFVFFLAVLAAAFAKVGTAVEVYGENSSKVDHFIWHESEYVPVVIDKTLRRASELRAHFLYFGRSVGAGSEVDGDRLPDSAWAVVVYLPRALIIGMLAPFPDSWSERVTLPRLVGAMETACWYFAFFGGAVTLVRFRSRKLLAGAVFCAVLITVLAYVHPNVGTLYRQRFGLWHFFMLIGCVGWVSLLRAYFPQRAPFDPVCDLDTELSEQKADVSRTPDRIAGTGAVVMLITLACYLGFFARDLLLTGELGLTGNLDAFFSAAMISMFFVSSLAMPLGDAFVLPFVAARRSAPIECERLLRGALGFALLILISVTCFVLFSAPWLAALVLHASSAETQALAGSMLRWFALIIALSAWTVIGNAALNSLGMPRDSALAQIAVPVVTLGALVLAPSGQIMTASIGGMLAGTLINAGIVFWRLRANGLTLLPKGTPFQATVEIRRLYLPLVAAAILPAALAPMNFAFAVTVTSGTVAAWAFSSKIVMLFSGLASVGATAVVLPQMAHRLMLRAGGHANQDASLLIAAAVWFGGVLMLGGFLFAESLVGSLFGKQLLTSQISDLASIVKVGLMQIPIVIVGALANKLAIASGCTLRVMHAAMFAFVANFVVNLVLVPKIGVMGVAVGALTGGVISVVTVLASVYRHIGLSLREIIFAMVCWLAWVAICLGLLSNSAAGLVSAVLALGAIARLQWIVLRGASSASNSSGSAKCTS